VAGCYECGDEPSGSCATELVKKVIRLELLIIKSVRKRPIMDTERCNSSQGEPGSSVSIVSGYELDDGVI
jgi:hypothetical protein